MYNISEHNLHIQVSPVAHKLGHTNTQKKLCHSKNYLEAIIQKIMIIYKVYPYSFGFIFIGNHLWKPFNSTGNKL